MFNNLFKYVLLIISCNLLLTAKSMKFPQSSRQNLHPDPIKKVLKSSMADFAADLAKYLNKDLNNDNIIFSPINIYSALYLVQLAADGNTKKEVENVLGWNSSSNEQNMTRNLAAFLKALSPTGMIDRNSYTRVKLANGIFVDNKFPVQRNFVEIIQNNFKSSKIENVDFQNGTSATDFINNWALQATDGRIPQLFPEPLGSNNVMVLASSLYFSGKWDEPFYPQATKSEKFDTGSKSVDVSMMRLTEFIPYVNDANLQFEAICKDYADHDYTMIFVLPHESQTLKNLSIHLTGDVLSRIASSANVSGVEYKIPRTKFSMKKSLKDALQKRGLKNAFQIANLKKMVTSNHLKLSDVLHAAEIEVNEDGTTASAITAVQVVYLSAPHIPTDPMKFILNRPFMMILYQRSTETIIFVGFVYSPIV